MAKSHNSHPAPEPQNRLAHAADTAREGLDDVTAKTVEIIEENPLAVLAGGLAIGAVVAALIPRSRRETRLLAPVGRHDTDRAKGAVENVKEGAKEQLGLLSGGSNTTADGHASPLVQTVLTALATAGIAALQKQGGGQRRASAND